MSNIFAGTELPGWMQDRMKVNAEHGQWGQLAGTALSGLMNGFRKDTNAPVDPQTGQQPRQGFMAGLNEAVRNQQDPMWKLKESQMQVDTLSRAAQAESTFALANERKQELQAWMEDVPAITPWLSMSPDKRADMPAPAVKSQKAMQAVEQVSIADSRYFNQKDQNRIREESTSLAKQQSQKWLDWQSSFAALDAPTRDAITKMGDTAYQRGPNGSIIGPSPAAEIVYNNSPDVLAGKKNPFGIGVVKADQRARQQDKKDDSAMDLVKARGDANIAAVKERGQQMQDLEKLRFSDRTARDKELQAFYKEPPKFYPGPTAGSFIMKSGRTTQVINPKTNNDMSLKGEMTAATKQLENAYAYKQNAILTGKGMDTANQMVFEAKDTMMKLEKRAAAISRPATGQEIQQLLPGEEPHDDNGASTSNPDRFKITPVN